MPAFAKVGDVALFLAGLLMVVAGVFVADQGGVQTVLILIGAGLMVMGAVLPRLSGTVKLGPGSVEMTVVQQLEATRKQAERLAPEHVEEAVGLAFKKLAESGALTQVLTTAPPAAGAAWVPRPRWRQPQQPAAVQQPTTSAPENGQLDEAEAAPRADERAAVAPADAHPPPRDLEKARRAGEPTAGVDELNVVRVGAQQPWRTRADRSTGEFAHEAAGGVEARKEAERLAPERSPLRRSRLVAAAALVVLVGAGVGLSLLTALGGAPVPGRGPSPAPGTRGLPILLMAGAVVLIGLVGFVALLLRRSGRRGRTKQGPAPEGPEDFARRVVEEVMRRA